MDICTSFELLIMNTMFKYKDAHGNTASKAKGQRSVEAMCGHLVEVRSESIYRLTLGDELDLAQEERATLPRTTQMSNHALMRMSI